MAGRRRLFLVSIAALLVVLANVALGGRIAAGARDIVAPLHGAGAAVARSIGMSGFFSSRSSLEAEITSLQGQVQEEQLQTAAFQAVEEENSALSQLTHLAQTAPGFAVPVTSSIQSSPYGTFTIGAGSAEGVQAGALVLEGNEFVVGTVTTIQTHASLVSEVFAPAAQTPVTIDGAPTVAVGEGGDAVAKVPHGVSVSQGDPVVAPGYGGRPIGTVAHVDTTPANAQQAIYISLPVALPALLYVYVTP